MPSDPLTRLALAMANDPGVYALLLGSGVSTGAGVPTGWGVQVDLMRQVATAEGADVADGDGEELTAWWREAHDSDPTYSALLEELAATPSERQTYLRGYFTPSEEERRNGIKVPGPAHEAIARLVANGAVRLILTTNFDPLIEQTLHGKGIDHDVWASEEEIEGGIPLEHGRVVVVKLHGDYQRINLRNTESELSSYPETIDGLLDRVFDSFGIVVCGWSGEHDHALREAIQRAPNRRYSWWWSLRGEDVTGVAEDLIEHRQAIVLPGRDADEMFTELADRHAALVEREREDAGDLGVVREVTARRAADRSQRQRLLKDVVDSAVSVRDALNDEDRFPPLRGSVTAESVVSRAGAMVELVRSLVERLAEVVAGADEDVAFSVTSRTFEVLADGDGRDALARIPLLLAWYAAGLIAVDHERLELLRRMATEVSVRRLERIEPLLVAVHPWRVVNNREAAAQWLANQGPTETKYYAPMSKWLEGATRDLLSPFPITATDDHWTKSFDCFEWACGVILVALAHGLDPGQDLYVPSPHIGNFGWRRDYLYDQRGKWVPLIEWATAHAEKLIPTADEDEREEILSSHLEQIQQVTRRWH